MSIRTDVTIDWEKSPRIVDVALPSTELNMQDMADTVRSLEHAPNPGFDVFSHDYLIDLAGKDDLGGGVLVGITATLRDGQVAFGRTGSRCNGTVTTADSNGVTLIDSAADFVTDGVQRGDWVINFTDQSVCEVLIVVDLNTLTCRPLSDGTDNEWGLGDSYKVWEVAECELSGGNAVGLDDVGGTINPLFTTFGRFATRTSSSSATLSEQADIQYASFNGGVTVDLTSSYSGTTYPTGTPREPVNNFTDALTIANERGFDTFYIMGDATIDSGLTYTGKTFVGESTNKSMFTISADAGVVNCEFESATVQGTLDGGNVLHDCSLRTINYVDGEIHRCSLLETVTLSGAGKAVFEDCWSGVPGANTPTIDMGGSGSELAIRNYAGGITLQNHSGTDDCSIDMNSGQIIVDDTITGTGDYILRGVGKWTNKDTYAGGATITNELIEYDVVGLREVVEGGYTGIEAVRILLAMAAGKLQQYGNPVSQVNIRDLADAKNRIEAFVDGDGNRLLVTLDVS